MASTSTDNYEQVAGSPQSMFQGAHRQVIGDAVATRTLLQKESGALCLFDRAAGVVYTLPAPVIGMEFEFETTVTVTSNAAKVITNAATVFIIGIVNQVIATSATTLASAFDGSTHVAISMNGSTKGGVIGDRLKLTCISATQWAITGLISGSGSLATPASTT